MKILNSNEFDSAIASGIVLVDFYADWCGPCKMLAPVLDGIAEKMTQVDFYKINVDTSSDIAGRYGVQAIPNLIIFKDGKAVDQITGFVPENEIVKRIENLF
ncbi:MAG: thioredoxin [Thomasclavelia sp.]|uniref:thioredoxin n=1 Tax=Thomasclavelia sp. TaxID=3025757 RepID=UPI0039A24D74